jgi:hypothetical protein
MHGINLRFMGVLYDLKPKTPLLVEILARVCVAVVVCMRAVLCVRCCHPRFGCSKVFSSVASVEWSE